MSTHHTCTHEHTSDTPVSTVVLPAVSLGLARRSAAILADAYDGCLRSRCWLTVSPERPRCPRIPSDSTAAATIRLVFELDALAPYASFVEDTERLVHILLGEKSGGASADEKYNVALVCAVIVMLQQRLWLSDGWPRALLTHMKRDAGGVCIWPAGLDAPRTVLHASSSVITPTAYVLVAAYALRTRLVVPCSS